MAVERYFPSPLAHYDPADLLDALGLGVWDYFEKTKAFKGFGLALAMNALGALSMGMQTPESPSGYTFMAFKPDLFLPAEEYRAELSRRIAVIKETPRQAGVTEIRIPGERASRTRAKLMAEGIVIDRKIHTALGRLAAGHLDHGG